MSTSGVGFINGNVEGSTVRFFDDHVDPEDPLSDEHGIIDYTISLQDDGLEMNGRFSAHSHAM